MNILLTSVGRRSYLVEYFQKVLQGSGKVHAANSSKITPAFRVADKCVVTPLIYDDNYIPFLLDYCQKEAIDVIISLFDIDLPILAKNKELFATYDVKVIVSDYKFISICNDKWMTYNFLKENDLAVPKTFISLAEAKMAIDNKELQYPVIIKPRWGMGSIGVYQAENDLELQVLYAKEKREIMSTYLKYESLIDLEQCILIQEKLDGQEYGMDVINDLHGNYVNTIVREKFAMRSGETDCALIVNDKRAIALGKRLSLLSKHIANLDVDIFKVKDEYYVLEMNARFGGGYPFSHIAGVNLPAAIIKWLSGEAVTQEMLEAKAGVLAHKDIAIVELDR